MRRSSSSRGTSRPKSERRVPRLAAPQRVPTGLQRLADLRQLERADDAAPVVRVDARPPRADRARRARHARARVPDGRRGAPSAPDRPAAAASGPRWRHAGRGRCRPRRPACGRGRVPASTARCASAWYSTTEASWSSSQIATSCVARSGCAVRIGSPRYTCIESAETSSAGMRSAICSATAVLPDAVGPKIASTSGLRGDERLLAALECLRGGSGDPDGHELAGSGRAGEVHRHVAAGATPEQ